MPAAVAVPLLSAGIGAGASMYGASRQQRGNRYAADLQSDYANKALQFEREQEATRRAEWEREQDEMRRQWDMREQNAEPYRRAAAGVLQSRFRGGQAPGLAGLLGGPRPYQRPQYPGSGGLSDLAR